MNRPVPVTPRLPQIETKSTASLKMSPEFRAFVDTVLLRYEIELRRELLNTLTQYAERLNHMVQGVGGDIASADRISVGEPIHRVSGTNSISFISAPAEFSGPIWLIPTGAWTLVTGGNISAAAQAAPGLAMMLVYNAMHATWSPMISASSVVAPVLYYHQDLVGTKNFVNKTFTYSRAIARDADGNPAAILAWKNDLMSWTTSNPPDAGFWTIDSITDEIKVGEAPEPNDLLRFLEVGVL